MDKVTVLLAKDIDEGQGHEAGGKGHTLVKVIAQGQGQMLARTLVKS